MNRLECNNQRLPADLTFVARFFIKSLLATSAQPQRRKTKKSNMLNGEKKNSEGAAHFLADFFAVIVRLTLSKLIRMALRHQKQ